ncbi:fusaric acid resistance protein [Mycolicibacterium pulveris]|uniref:Fusaric acid resistance protein n=1 Tax=Mycolicibacterium pulveris TaxID=36813 RepID=A0A7I7UQ37_MYCPV|nr:fusaric acid resistance protein [Mycolicibacterium pulveris]
MVTTGGRIVEALRPTLPDIGAVVRSLLAMVAIAVVALLWHSGTAALWAAGAAAIAGAIALQDSPGGRVSLVVTVSLQMGCAVLLGALTGAYNVLFVVAVAVWCFGAGLQWALGGNAGLVGAAASALLVIAPPVTPSVSSVLVPTVLTIAAGCLQAVLIAVWPPQRWRTQREALSNAYRSLADDARQVAADRAAPLDAALSPSLRDAFMDTQASRRPEAYLGGHRLPERIMTTLHAFRGSAGGEHDDVSRVLDSAAAVLDALADDKHTARREAEHALVRVDTAVSMITGPEAATAQRLSQQLHEAAELRFPDLYRPDLVNPMRRAIGAVRGHLTLTSPILRHAVRLSAAVTLGIAADRFAPVNHGYWAALTVLMVLRPETAHTYTRCMGRIAGIAAGIVVTSSITLLVEPSGYVAAVLATLLVGITYSVARFGYIAASAALAGAVVFLLDIGAATSGATLEDRLFSVVIGGGLAMVAHVAFPDHALIRLWQRSGELLKTEIDYAATVIKAFVHELDRPADAVSAAWQKAFRARASFEAACGAARLDSPELRRWLRSYRAALNAVTSSCTTLEASLPPQPLTNVTPEFVAAIDDYVDALRGAPPTPAAPWTVDLAALSAASQQVRDRGAELPADNGAARVLVAEIATITRHLSSIATVREPTSAG